MSELKNVRVTEIKNQNEYNFDGWMWHIAIQTDKKVHLLPIAKKKKVYDETGIQWYVKYPDIYDEIKNVISDDLDISEIVMRVTLQMANLNSLRKYKVVEIED